MQALIERRLGHVSVYHLPFGPMVVAMVYCPSTSHGTMDKFPPAATQHSLAQY